MHLDYGIKTAGPGSNMKVNNMLAKALYDNKAECPDELAFRKGDILMVLEQNVVGSEGWWNCSLHGRQGLAPANRLQVLASSPMDTPLSYGSIGRKESPQNIYQVPTAARSPTASITYEEMDTLYQTPTSSPPLSKDVYQVPASSPAKLFCDRTQSSTNQRLFTLPRASRASNPSPGTGPQSEVYDVPSPQRRGSLLSTRCATPPSARKGSLPALSAESFQQLPYDFPPTPEEAEKLHQQGTTEGNVYDVPPPIRRDFAEKDRDFEPSTPDHYKTLPNPRKSDWIYDIPVSPEKIGMTTTPPSISPERPVLYNMLAERRESGSCYNVLSSYVEGRAGNSQIYDVPPVQKKQSFSSQPVYDVPTSRDMPILRPNGNYDVPPNYLINKMEQQSSKEIIYDIPKGSPTAPNAGSQSVRNSGYETQIYDIPPPLPRDNKSSCLSLEQDRLSVASTESRGSTFSMSSSTSMDSFSASSSSDESAKEVTLKLDVAIERLSQLQHRVASAIASLMIYVSSKWRFQEYLEENLEEIHRSVDSIKESLAEFLDFAQGVKWNAVHLTDTNLQIKINKQLHIITDSYQILLETREALNKCKWSLGVLVVTKPQTSPDALDRFVMVARTIPEDIKRFVSIIIANGKLLFKNNSENNEAKSPKPQEQSLPWSKTEMKEKDTTYPRVKQTEGRGNVDITIRNAIEECEYVHLQKKEEFEKILNLTLHRRMSNKQQLEEKASKPSYRNSNQRTPDSTNNKGVLSEHCRLYFGALQKATSVFNNSLGNNQPPEVFIGHSKLIIMVGQKLVDNLCRQVQENDARNDILCRSSQLCTLLKNLAVATKTAAIQYPNPAALQDLKEQANQLAQETQQFRASLD
ncbi:cas scaffolding protein family member 4 isoform X2 [Ambystoma mexicanum]|uniref:cas scaffolding protein family member 4 isoform X2 n=1 Tax=Ambystoma mexicanum TaxID=8296 RepID=UPI0037E80368